ncbi:ogr/Delta-like zinc finger family protein [Acinetobacter rathckeae]|uniref:ogr/Delta-like zinc finger family protein n=1 Tax=Acinetobacter rathckeae TaxID=2605272 RepID=UPI003898FC9E
MKCPICGSASHIRTSRYITKMTKEAYYQCRNTNCSATFKTNESVVQILQQPRSAYEHHRST